MKKLGTKSLALVLALLMLVTALPMSVFAAQNPATCQHLNLSRTLAKAATATAHGNIDYWYCSDCESYFKTASNNFPDTSKVLSEEDTEIHFYAEDKDYVLPEDAADHIKTAATCEHGTVYYKACAVCGKYSKDLTFTANDKDDHNYGVFQVTKKATCTDAGEQRRTCKVCGYVDVQEIPALGHEPEAEYTVAAGADCTVAAFDRWIKCARCGQEMPGTRETVAKREDERHDPAFVNEIPATCTSAGKEAGMRCKLCLKYSSGGEAIAQLPHKIVKDAAVAADCWNTGLTEGQHCETCDTQTVAQIETPKLTHKVINVTPKANTCTEDGYAIKASFCEYCHYVFSPDTTYDKVVIKALGHNYVEVTAKEATVSTKGNIKHWTCTNMKDAEGKTITEYFVRPQIESKDAQGNVIKDKNGNPVMRDITVSDKEAKDYPLNDGQFVYREVTEADVTIPVKNHNHNYQVVVAESTPATCTEDGKEVTECAICHDKKEKVLPKTNHKYDGWTITEPATCQKEGSMCHKCLNCGEVTDVTPIDKTDHDFKLESAADCTKGGTATYKCSMCGTTKTEQVSKQDSHTDANDDGICDVCSTQFCTCICHSKQWYGPFVYFILRVWWEFLGIHQTCDFGTNCPKVHYTKANTNIPSING